MCPTASQIVAYLKAGVYWDDNVAGEGQQSYSSPDGSQGLSVSNKHTGLWVKKSANIPTFNTETETYYQTNANTFKKLSTLTEEEIKNIRTKGEYFFLPAAGVYENGAFWNAGTYGDYWSSTSKDDLYAYFLDFDFGHAIINYGTRSLGYLPMVIE